MRIKGSLVSLTIGGEVYKAEGLLNLKPTGGRRQLHSQRITVNLKTIRASQDAIDALVEFGRLCQWSEMWRIIGVLFAIDHRIEQELLSP